MNSSLRSSPAVGAAAANAAPLLGWLAATGAFFVLHLGGMSPAIRPGAAVAERVGCIALCAADAIALSSLCGLLLLLLRRRPGVATALGASLIGVTACLLFIDTKILVFFGQRRIAWTQLRTESSVLANAGIPAWSIALVLISAAIFGAGWFYAVQLVRRRQIFAPRWAWILLGVSIIAAAAVIVAANPAAAGQGASWRRRSVFYIEPANTPPHEMPRERNYPVSPYAQTPLTSRPDILIVVGESLRAAEYSAEVMPRTWAASQAAFRAPMHYSGSNCTSSGLFTLLYGTNASASRWVDRRPSYPLRWLQEQGYRLEVYSGESLEWRGLRTSMFSNFDRIFQPSNPRYQVSDDINAAAAAVESLSSSHSSPRFVVLILNATHHDYQYPPQFERFKPAAAEIDLLSPGAGAELEPLKNRYRNAVAFLDDIIGGVLEKLQVGPRPSPLVVITGDHGEEFLEHGSLVHASNLFDPQTRVPFIAFGIPGLDANSASGLPTSHEQVLPTILRAIAPGIDTSPSGTGRAIGDQQEYPFIVSECDDSGGYVSIAPSGKTWLHSERGTVVWGETRADDSARPAYGAPPNAQEVLGKLAYFASKPRDQLAWPCVARTVDGANFHICDASTSWPAARYFCQSHGADLAWFDDDLQAQHVAQHLRSRRGKQYWIGLGDEAEEGKFRWINGATPRSVPWAHGEPNGGRNENCVDIFAGSGEWNDERCEKAVWFVCRGP